MVCRWIAPLHLPSWNNLMKITKGPNKQTCKTVLTGLSLLSRCFRTAKSDPKLEMKQRTWGSLDAKTKPNQNKPQKTESERNGPQYLSRGNLSPIPFNYNYHTNGAVDAAQLDGSATTAPRQGAIAQSEVVTLGNLPNIHNRWLFCGFSGVYLVCFMHALIVGIAFLQGEKGEFHQRESDSGSCCWYCLCLSPASEASVDRACNTI